MNRKLSWQVAVLSLWQADVFIFAMAVAVLGALHWTVVAGLMVLGSAAVWVTLTGAATRTSVAAGWIGTGVAWSFLLAHPRLFHALEIDHLAIAGLTVVGLLTAAQRADQPHLRCAWRVIGLAWGGLSAGLWLSESYLQNLRVPFYCALVATVALLVACRILLKLPGPVIQFVHTLILLLVALPIANHFTQPKHPLDTRPETGRNYYSFESARKDPDAFATWWYFFLKQWDRMHRTISIEDPDRLLPYKFQPNAEARIFQSEVKINSLGFRGPEIHREKGRAYRIVALGESTTFGCTITKAGKPWPRLLEAMLNQELKPDRPIEVINAGVYAFTLEENLKRMTREILPLHPDMILSYHGYNFFSSLSDVIPPPRGAPPPAYQVRPLKLLGDTEYRLKMLIYKRRQRPPAKPAPSKLADPMTSDYARAYEELIGIARTNGIKLVVANYSMAVNEASDPDLVDFYRAAFPKVRASIRANRAHSALVAQLVRAHPEVQFVDTHPALDGRHQYFIDLMHFTQEGRERMARTFFEGIRDVVAQDLAQSKSPGELQPWARTVQTSLTARPNMVK